MTVPALPPAARRLARQRAAGVFLMLLLLVLSGVAGYRVSERAGMRDLRVDTSHQLDLMTAAIDREVTRHAHIPGAVGLNPDVLDLLRQPASGRAARQRVVNSHLERLNAHIDGLAIFVLDLNGIVVASSDWIYSDNVLGADFSYRPFFRAALAGAPYRQFGVDAIRNEPGYFFAQPIRDEHQDWRVIGVAVVKSGIASLERRWLAREMTAEPALIADGNGVVLLASSPEWKYSTLKPLSGEVIADIRRQQFDGRAPGAFSLDIDVEAASEGALVSLPGLAPSSGEAARGRRDFFAFSRHLPESAWRLLVFANLRPVRTQALTHGALAAAAVGCLLLGMLYLRQRRRALRTRLESQALLKQANQALERKVAERTADLSEAVSRLEAEVGERKRAEFELRAAQDELVQAAKLAVLGQLATGITHELNQPLGAVRTLSGNAIEFMKRGNLETAENNLRIVGQLAEQMGGIITPLKTFARKSPALSSAVDVAHVVASALFLFDQRLQRGGVSVDNRCRPGEFVAWCDQNRLQQVLVNLIGNAIDAMLVQPARRLTISAERGADGRIALAVADTGGGLTPDVRERLFEPFFTTKPAGEGLGLGLVISRDIVRDFGGDLSAEGAPGGGARFVIHLPTQPEQGAPAT